MRVTTRLRLAIYNYRNDTKIVSDRASLDASYERGVLIGPNTFVDRDVSVGAFSYVNRNSSVENAMIGRYCSISSGVFIGPFEHATSMRSQHPVALRGIEFPKRPPVYIGNDVLISLNAIVLAGVTIGDGAVIGAGAVVTRDVGPYEVVGGVPARKLKDRLPRDEVAELQTLAWWNWERDKVERNAMFLRRETSAVID